MESAEVESNTILKLLAFLSGLGSLTQVKIMGYAGITELMFAAIAPILLATNWRALRDSRLFPFFLLAVGWMLSAWVSDVYRESSQENLLKGCAAVALWICCLLGMFHILSRNLDNIRWFLFGMAISSLISILYFKPGSILGLEEMADGESVTTYRTVYAGAVFHWIVASSAILYRKFPQTVVTAFFAYAVVSFHQGSRSAGALGALIGCLILYARAIATPNCDSRLHPKPVQFVWVTISVVLVVSLTYEHATMKGWLGEEQKNRFLQQSESKVGILAGRGEFAAALFAIADSPLLGHGTWAKDTQGYRLKGAELLGIEVPITTQLRYDEMLIPAHSHIWGAWVSSGLLGGLFWIYVFLFLVRFFRRHLLAMPAYLAYVLAINVSFSWNVLFSPFGQRPVNAAHLVFLILIAQQADVVSDTMPDPE